MKKFVILAIAIILFVTPKQHTEQSTTAPEGTPPNTTMGQTEKMPEANTEQREQITEATSELISIESEVAAKQDPAGQETPVGAI